MKIRFGPEGLHAFDRTTGANALVDELTFPESAWSLAPRQVSIALTNACDLECFFCYAPKVPGSLRIDTLKAWVSELDSAGTAGIGFGGGEPTLYKRLPELCHFAQRETGMAVTITTHAHRMSPVLLDELKGSINFIRVSMDGVGDTYERIRGRSFDVFTTKLLLVSELAPFGINYVVNSETVVHLDAAADFAERMGCKELLLLPQQRTGDARAADSLTRAELTNWVRSYGGRLPLTLASSEDLGSIPRVCPVGDTGLRSYAHITARGILQSTSYATSGVLIDGSGVMKALHLLNDMEK